MRRFTLSPEAAADLQEIRTYLTQEAGPSITKSVFAKIREAFVQLARTPGMGHSREDLTDEPLRFWSVFSYLVIYDPATKPIEIVRVLHGRREVDSILKDQ